MISQYISNALARCALPIGVGTFDHAAGTVGIAIWRHSGWRTSAVLDHKQATAAYLRLVAELQRTNA